MASCLGCHLYRLVYFAMLGSHGLLRYGDTALRARHLARVRTHLEGELESERVW